MSDYISREEALDALAEYVVSGFAESADDLQSYTDKINNIPSADVRENIHGEWTRHTRVEPVYSIDGVKTWGVKCQCNQCTFTTIVVEDFGYYRYCPNCGADMKGGE